MSDDEIANALLDWLATGERGGGWMFSKQELAAEFALRFPRLMPKIKTKVQKLKSR